jgi:hypothetical protein
MLDNNWRKGSRCLYDGECMEVRWADPFVEVRDSKDTAGPILRFTPGVWAAFIRSVTGGEPNRAGISPDEPRVAPRRP